MLVVVAGTGFIAATYGLVRLAYGLFLPDIQRELGLSDSAAGYVSTGSSLFYCLAAVVGFFFAARHARLLIVGAAVSACVGVWGMAVADSSGSFGIFAVISSAGAGCASPALVRIVARNVDDGALARAQSTVNAGTGLGLVCAGTLALNLLPQWRTAWVLIGVVVACLAVAVLAADRIMTAEVTAVQALSTSWVSLHTRCITAAVLMGAGSSAVWTYGRTLLVQTGIGSEGDTVTAWIALGLGATAVIATARPMAALTSAYAWMCSCALMTVAIAVLALGPPNLVSALVACVIFGWGFTAATSALISWTAEISPDHAAAGTAMLFVALVFGQALGSGVVGVVVTAAGFGTAFAVAAALTAAATAVVALPVAARARV